MKKITQEVLDMAWTKVGGVGSPPLRWKDMSEKQGGLWHQYINNVAAILATQAGLKEGEAFPLAHNNNKREILLPIEHTTFLLVKMQLWKKKFQGFSRMFDANHTEWEKKTLESGTYTILPEHLMKRVLND